MLQVLKYIQFNAFECRTAYLGAVDGELLHNMVLT